MSESNPMQLTVAPEDAGARLDAWLAGQIPGISRSRAQGLIESGHATSAGRVLKASHRVCAGEPIEVRIPPLSDPAPRPQAIPLDIRYEDGDLLVIDKPSGLVAHPAPGHAEGTLVNALLHHCADLSGLGGERRPGIVHRLDRDTSGLLIVAKNDAAHRALSEALANRTVHREYIAVVSGKPASPEGRIEASIGRSSSDRQKMAIDPVRGRHAATRWRVERWGRGVAILRLRLETGRTHQIRVHLASIRLPIIGDRAYGLARKGEIDRIPHEESALIQAISRVERQMLHAARIEFLHPTDGRAMAFEVPPPPDMQALMDAIAGVETQAEMEKRLAEQRS